MLQAFCTNANVVYAIVGALVLLRHLSFTPNANCFNMACRRSLLATGSHASSGHRYRTCGTRSLEVEQLVVGNR